MNVDVIKIKPESNFEAEIFIIILGYGWVCCLAIREIMDTE